MTKPKQPAHDKPRKPRKMWVCPHTKCAYNAKYDPDHLPVLVFDLSPASVDALREKVDEFGNATRSAVIAEATQSSWATDKVLKKAEERLKKARSELHRALGFPTSGKARK